MRARPSQVFGPVLVRALSRLALILHSLVKQSLLLRRFQLHLNFDVLDLLRGPAHCFGEDGSTADRARATHHRAGSLQR